MISESKTIKDLSKIPNFKIIITISHLGPGGAQKNAMRIAEILAKKYRILILTFNSSTENDIYVSKHKNIYFYNLPLIEVEKSIFFRIFGSIKKIIFLKKLFGFLYWVFQIIFKYLHNKILPVKLLSKVQSSNVINQVSYIFKITNPSLIISFLTLPNLISCLSVIPNSNNQRTKIIVSERNNIYKEYSFISRFFISSIYKYTKSKLKNKFIYSANNLVSKKFVKDGIYLPNIIDINSKILSNRIKRKKQFLYIGRFVKQKNLIFILNTFSNFIKIVPGWKLLIVGDGPEKQKMEILIKQKNLSKNIIIKDFTNDKNKLKNYYLESSFFISASSREGTPNVMLESMIYNLDFISYDFCENMKILGHKNLIYLLSKKNPVEDLINLVNSKNKRSLNTNIDNFLKIHTNDYVEKILKNFLHG